MEKLIKRLEACNHALEYATWNYSEMKLEDLEPNVIESTGVAESCLIEVRNNNLTIEELRASQKADTGISNCTIDSVKPMLLKIADYLDCAAELANKVEEFDELHDIVSLMKGIVEDNEMFIRN